MSDLVEETEPADSATSPAFAELRSNLQYARGLIHGGRSLGRLQIGAFDVTDLYRAAWVQAVSALDHWVHRELYDRAVGLAARISTARPRGFLRITVPMSLFEGVYHHSEDLPTAFRNHLRAQFGHLSFQQPDKIKAAFDMVSDDFGWPAVATRLGEGGERVDAAVVKERLAEIAKRRNRIAHETDREPRTGRRTPLTAEETTDAIDWVERIAAAAIGVLGPTPEEPPRRRRWQRADLEAASAGAHPAVAGAVRALMAHADRNGARFNGGAGLSPSASFYYPTRQNQRPLWAVYLTPERPSMTLNLQIVAGVDRDLARRLIGDLRRIAVVNDALPNDDEALLDRYPTVYLAALGEDPVAVNGVLAAFDRVVEGWL